MAACSASASLKPNALFDISFRSSALTETRDIRFLRIVMPTHRSEEHTSELQSLMRTSYAVFCLKKKKIDIKAHLYITYDRLHHTTPITEPRPFPKNTPHNK